MSTENTCNTLRLLPLTYFLRLTILCILIGNAVSIKDESSTISTHDEFLTILESEALLKSYEPLLQGSMHKMGNNGISRGGKYRTSQSVRLPPLGDDLLLDLERRAALLMGMDHKHCEDFQLSCYGEDELFGLHRDDTDDPKQSLNRGATVLVYLSSPELGGETLFTHRALEDELDLDTGKRLTTQDGALKLFRHYCNSPKQGFEVVKPIVGRAVFWRTWNENDTVFAKNSTHGACPVQRGTKCVIQQWLYHLDRVHPLRDPRVAAIFPAGADSRYKTQQYYESSSTEARNCIFDVSAKKRSIIPNLCMIKNSDTQIDNYETKSTLFQLNELDYGPFTGISSLRIKSPLVTSFPLNLIQSGFTISFHAANLPSNSVLISLDNYVSVIFRGRTDQGLTFELSSPSQSTSKISFFYWGLDTDWFWYSFTYHPTTNLSSFSVYSQRKQLGKSTVSLGDTNIATTLKNEIIMQLFRHPLNDCSINPHEKVAFVSKTCDSSTDADESFVDVSFIIFHASVIEDEKELIALSRQAMRYDINT